MFSYFQNFILKQLRLVITGIKMQMSNCELNVYRSQKDKSFENESLPD
jgi:hypothetical protein